MASKMDSKVRSQFGKMKLSDGKKSADFDHYPLRMTADKKTEMYVKFAKVLLIFQGPGTENRRLAVNELNSKFRCAGRVVSDGSFERETASRFADYKVDDFYRYFRSRVKKSMEEGCNLIVIDQSMANMRQMKYYCYLAQKMQYLILPYPPLVDNDRPEREAVMNQAVKFKLFSERPISQPNYFKHLFCGWFLHDVDSTELRGEASLYVQDCYDNIVDFREMLSNICKSCDFQSYYNMVDKRQDLAFCAVKILQNPLDTRNYMSDEAFVKSYGKMSKLLIVGFIISPHMIAARVKLTHEQKKLWEMADDLDEKNQPTVYPTKLLESTKVDMPDEEVTLIASKSNRTIISGEPILEPTKVIHHQAKGRSCHILLGKVDGAPPRNVNYDAAFAVFRERNVTEKYSDELRSYDLDRCLARRIGKYWIIYLKETLIVNGLFASCCSVDNA